MMAYLVELGIGEQQARALLEAHRDSPPSGSA
jgi:hypothetical protein